MNHLVIQTEVHRDAFNHTNNQAEMDLKSKNRCWLLEIYL